MFQSGKATSCRKSEIKIPTLEVACSTSLFAVISAILHLRTQNRVSKPINVGWTYSLLYNAVFEPANFPSSLPVVADIVLGIPQNSQTLEHHFSIALSSLLALAGRNHTLWRKKRNFWKAA